MREKMFWTAPSTQEREADPSLDENSSLEDLPRDSQDDRKAESEVLLYKLTSTSSDQSNDYSDKKATQSSSDQRSRTPSLDSVSSPIAPRRKNRPLSMHFVKCLSGLYCLDCGTDPFKTFGVEKDGGSDGKSTPSGLANLQALQHVSSSTISPLVLAPMMMDDPSAGSIAPFENGTGTFPKTDQRESSIGKTSKPGVESILGEYMALCRFYSVPYNAGVLSTLRFSLPCLRVTGAFHDLDSECQEWCAIGAFDDHLPFVRCRLNFSFANLPH